MSNEPTNQASWGERDSRRGRSASSTSRWEGRNRPGGTRQRRQGEGRRRQPPVKPEAIDWKDVRTLRPFLDDVGRIRPQRKTGASVKMQRAIARAVKRARFMALLPYTSEHIRTTGKEE